MKSVEDRPTRLADLYGIGAKLQQQLIAAFQTEDNAVVAIRARDIPAFLRAGLKKQFAIRIIRQALSEGYKMLLSPDSRDIYKKVIDLLRDYPQLNEVKDRVSTLVPNYWSSDSAAHLEKVMTFKALVVQAKPPEIEKIIKVLAGADYRPVNAPDLPSSVVVVSTQADVADRWTGKLAVQVITSAEALQERARETPFLRILADDIDAAPDGSVVLPTNASSREVYPELIVKKATRLKGYLQAYQASARLAPDNFPLAGQLGDAATALTKVENQLRALDEERALLEGSLDAVGAEVRKLDQEEVSREDLAKIFKKFASDADFLIEFDAVPIKSAKEIIDFSINRYVESKRYAACRKAAKALSPLIAQAKDIITAVQELDYWLALGRFAAEFDLTSPRMVLDGSHLYFEEGQHLFLAQLAQKKSITRFDSVKYAIGPPPSPLAGVEGEKIALLTGANSGGKTCLLETIFFIALLPHLGLPVPAKNAEVPAIKGIFFHRRHLARTAGALEGTLKRLMPAFSKAAHTLVLVDEFEAITEPGAAARILSGLINILADQATLAVFVTHLSNEIAKVVGPVARLDAIQAAGLDRNLELITDHQPVFGQVGRSTPELIIQKLLKSSKSKYVQKHYQSLQNTLAAGQVTWQTRIDWFLQRRAHKTGRTAE